MKLVELINSIPGFNTWPHVEKIKLFGWFYHTFEGSAHFSAKDLSSSYLAMNLNPPGNVHGLLVSLVNKRPREVLKTRDGYRLEATIRQGFTSKYGKNPITVQVTKLLEELPGRIKDPDEKIYLEEAIKCFKAGSPRGAIVMTWNLAFSHLCSFIVGSENRQLSFNSAWQSRFPAHHKKKQKLIQILEDFSEELKESQVIEISKSAGIITSDVFKIMKEKLDKRNSAAHPSRIAIGRLQAEAFIDDLIKNVVMKLM